MQAKSKARRPVLPSRCQAQNSFFAWSRTVEGGNCSWMARARLAPAEYTDCQPLQFRTALGVHVAGIARFLLSPPEFSVYMSPIQIDPARPATAGMAEDTWALNEGVIDEDAFLRQAYAIFEERERMFLTPSRPRAAAWWPALSIPVIAYSTCSTAGWAPGIRMPA